MDSLYPVGSLLVLPYWFFMIFAPRRTLTRRLIESPLLVVAPAVVYALLLLPRLSAVLPIVLHPTQAGITGFLGSPDGALLVWFHFLALDLFVGRWVYLNSRARHVNVWLMGPILFLTLLLGPPGLLVYLFARTVVGRPRRVIIMTVNHLPPLPQTLPMRVPARAMWATLIFFNQPAAFTGLACGVGLLGGLAGMLLGT